MESLVIGGVACAGLALLVLISFSLAVEGYEDDSGFHERRPRRTLGQVWRSKAGDLYSRALAAMARESRQGGEGRVIELRDSHEN